MKPENILYNCDQNGNIEIAISDFGQAGRTGGTPGWTWPKFLAKREPGKSDLYSVALLVLYVMCDEREVFYRVRNNYVENFGQLWLTAIQNDSFFKLIIYMINLKVTPTEAKDWWNQISGQVQIITKDYLCRTFGVDRSFLEVQDGIDRFNLLDATVLDRLFITLATDIVKWMKFQNPRYGNLIKNSYKNNCRKPRRDGILLAFFTRKCYC